MEEIRPTKIKNIYQFCSTDSSTVDSDARIKGRNQEIMAMGS